MSVRYIYFILIPVFFAITSCARPENKVDNFLEFSTEHKNVKKTSTDKSQTVKPAEKKSAEVTEEKPNEPETPNPPAKASTKDLDFLKRYNIGYLTFDVADFYAEIRPIKKMPDYTEYKFRVYAKTNSFMNYVFGWMSYTSSTFRVYNNKVVPEDFKTKITFKKKTREMALEYDVSSREVTYDEVVPPDNRLKRAAVEDTLKTNTYDPLSIFVEARRIVMNSFKYNNFDENGVHKFTLPLFDGRRRSNINIELYQQKVGGLYQLKLTQRPVAGYTNKELYETRNGERVISVFIDPQSFLPVSALGKSVAGSARAKFVEDCEAKSLETCIKKNEAGE